ncbi:MAG TPA: glycosyltransferase family 2 protein [Solirubrobacterales bacterium]|nr:glycosyltransferase family 2 protein [Solirubrobacterales bacterium]
MSVVTATYQRAGTLPRLWDSLLAQDAVDLEWVVVDDGSTDGTVELIRAWQEEAPFPVIYEWQRNQGKHAAINRGVEAASGEFCAVMDSDDWYVPGALASMLAHWRAIPAGMQDQFASVEGLSAEPGGELVGDRFPQPTFDSNTFEIDAVHGVQGDTMGMYRRDVLLAHPFPEDLGWHISPALVWNRIAARYSTRFVNEIWAYKEYLPEGLSERDTELRLRYAAAQLLYWREFAAMPRPMPLRAKLRAHANYVRYSLVEKKTLREQFEDSPSRRWTALAWVIGALLLTRDRVRVRRGFAEPSTSP